MASGYIGKVSHSGVQKVSAPNPSTGEKGEWHREEGQ